MRVGLVLLAAALLQASACERSSGRDSVAGRLEGSWTGADTGRMSGPARAEWCDSLGVLEIRAVRGDTGLALAVYPTDTVEADSYPVRRPSRAAPKPPASGVAARWFAETSIRGFQGERGAVVIDRAGDLVSGRFQAAMRSVNDTGRLELSGRFTDLRVARAGRGCVSRRGVERPDSGVH